MWRSPACRWVSSRSPGLGARGSEAARSCDRRGARPLAVTSHSVRSLCSSLSPGCWRPYWVLFWRGRLASRWASGSRSCTGSSWASSVPRRRASSSRPCTGTPRPASSASGIRRICSSLATQVARERGAGSRDHAVDAIGPGRLTLNKVNTWDKSLRATRPFVPIPEEDLNHGPSLMEWRDRVRPREYPRQALRGDRGEGPLLHDVARDLHDRAQAAVHLPEGQRARRLEGDGERLRVREGPVRDPEGRRLREDPARGDEGPRGRRLRRCDRDFAPVPGAELLPGSGRAQPETVRAGPAG